MGMHLFFIQHLSVGAREFTTSSRIINKKTCNSQKINRNILLNKNKNQRKFFFDLKALLGPSGGFFGVGSSEVLVIGAVAWLVLGPKRLYQLARDIGKISAEFKNVTEEARVTFQKAVNTDIEVQEKEKSNPKKKRTNPEESSANRLAALDSLVETEISNIKKKNKNLKFYSIINSS